MSTATIENYLQKVQSVIGCKVTSDKKDQISEIYIVSDLGRSPKQILRDVEAIMMSEFSTQIDYKKVSIAQIPSGSIRYYQDSRLKLKSIEYNCKDANVQVRATLEKEAAVFECELEGVNTVRNFNRLIGSAVLGAVEQSVGVKGIFVFEDAKRVELANVEVMLISITSIHGGEEKIFTGTATIDNNINKAIAKATLDAVNRHTLHSQV